MRTLYIKNNMAKDASSVNCIIYICIIKWVKESLYLATVQSHRVVLLYLKATLIEGVLGRNWRLRGCQRTSVSHAGRTSMFSRTRVSKSFVCEEATRALNRCHTHTHTHTHIYIYICVCLCCSVSNYNEHNKNKNNVRVYWIP